MKKLINDKSFKKSFRIVIFFISFISLTFGGYTLCKLIFDTTNDGSIWDGTVATSFASGTGTSTDPYIVSTPEEFAYIQTACTNNVYIKLSNDIYFTPSNMYIEYNETNDNYIMNVGNNTYNFNPDTGLYNGTSGTLISYSTNRNQRACHINGDNHKVYGLYISEDDEASLLHDFIGSIENIFFQNTFIYGVNATLINTISDSTVTNVYYEGILASSGEMSNTTNPNNLVTYIKNQDASDSNIVQDTESNGTTNYRYIGSSPSNYACLGGTSSDCSDGELYRIIGIFSDDAHGQTGKELVKLIRASALSTTLEYDHKGRNVGSRGNTSKYSSDWSDAQLMYLLNGTHYVNSGYKIGGTSPIHNWTNTNGSISDGTTVFYIVNGSYYDGGGTVNKPKSVSSGSNYTASSKNQTTISGLNDAARELVEEVDWHTGMIAYLDQINAQQAYAYEIGANRYTSRPDYWTGKIGLISVSDFIYATSGNGSHTRAQCLAYGHDNSYTEEECEKNNWLSFDYDYDYYFMIPSDSIWDTEDEESVWGFESDALTGWYWYISGVDWTEFDYDVLPSLYVKENTIITSGSGTESSPYMLSLPTTTTATNYSSLIGYSTNTTYSKIKVNGNINAEYNAAGLIYRAANDTVQNFQINSDIKANKFNMFIATGSSSLANGYYSGDINANTTINNDSSITYTYVYALGTLNGTLTNNTSGTNIVSQSISSTTNNYIAGPDLIDSINDIFTAYNGFWTVEDEVLPELKMNTSSSRITATLTITDTTTSTNYHEYTSTINSPNIYTMSNGFDFEVSNITNASLLKEIGYYLSTSILTDPSSVTYTDLTDDEITINTTGNYIVYIKITDIDNNVTYINSDMIMVGNIAYYTKTTTATEIINKDIIISETYTLTNNEPSGGYRRLCVSSIPAGTKIVLIDGNVAYTYTATGTEDYINLSSFKIMNFIIDSYHSGTGSSSITLYYDFSNTMGGTLNVNLQYYNNNIIQGYTTTETNDTTIIDSISTGNSTISITSSDTINLNTIGSYNINYNITSSSATEYHYLTYSLYNSSNTKITNSVIDGISITYNGNKYYSDSNGNIIIPLGYISSTSISTTLNVEHLNNVNIPGTYYIKTQIDDDNTLQYQVSLSYMTNNLLKDKMVVDYTNQVLYKDSNRTLTFTIYNDTETSLYQNETISASVSLYKKETLGSSTYSLIDISNYTSLNEVVNTSDKSYMLNDDLDKYNSNPASIVFNNSITTGAYQLKIDYYIENTYVSSDYIYFIVK